MSTLLALVALIPAEIEFNIAFTCLHSLNNKKKLHVVSMSEFEVGKMN